MYLATVLLPKISLSIIRHLSSPRQVTGYVASYMAAYVFVTIYIANVYNYIRSISYTVL